MNGQWWRVTSPAGEEFLVLVVDDRIAVTTREHHGLFAVGDRWSGGRGARRTLEGDDFACVMVCS